MYFLKWPESKVIFKTSKTLLLPIGNIQNSTDACGDFCDWLYVSVKSLRVLTYPRVIDPRVPLFQWFSHVASRLPPWICACTLLMPDAYWGNRFRLLGVSCCMFQTAAAWVIGKLGEIESASFGNCSERFEATCAPDFLEDSDAVGMKINEGTIRRNGKMHVCVVEGQVTLLIVEVPNCILRETRKLLEKGKLPKVSY